MLPKFLKDMPHTESTLPDTNNRPWAMLAAIDLRRQGYNATAVLDNDQWCLVSQDFPETLYMNLPVIKFNLF